MESTSHDRRTDFDTSELKRISSVSGLALLLFGLAIIMDGPISIFAWVLTGAGLLCLVYVVIASRIVLYRHRPISQKPDSQ